MEFASYLQKLNFYRYFLIAALFTWASTMTTAYFLKSSETVLIGIDSSGTRYISRSDDPLLQTEVVNFLVHFSENLYNFSPSTYFNKVGLATELMTPELWEKEKSSLLRTGDIVKKEDVALQSKIEKIEKTAREGVFLVVLSVVERKKLSSRNKTVNLTVTLHNIARTVENPWGLLVEGYDETTTN